MAKAQRKAPTLPAGANPDNKKNSESGSEKPLDPSLAHGVVGIESVEDMSPAEAAIFYGSELWHVFPCKADKRPATRNGVKDATDDLRKIKSWWKHRPDASIGLAIPPGLIVIDVDPHNGGSVEALEDLLGPLPKTLTSWSGRDNGGAHYWFRVPDNVEIRGRIADGLDIKKPGGYVIAPPSIHAATGQPYRWDPHDIEPLPATALETIKRKPVEPVDVDDIEIPTADELAGWKYGLVHTVEHAQEGYRDDFTYWSLNRARDGHAYVWIDGQELADLMTRITDAALSTGLTQREIDATDRSSENTPRQPPELKRSTAEDVFDPVEPDSMESGSTGDSELDALRRLMVDGKTFIFDIPEVIPAIWGNDREVLWAEGESLMIVGPSGVGKTTLTGQLLHRLLFGGELLGLPVVPIQGKILYLAMDRPEQIRRSLARHFDPSEAERAEQHLNVWKGPPPSDIAANPDILAKMCKAANADVVVIDSVKDAAIGLSDDAVGSGYNRARQLALADGVQVLELHHQVKRGPRGEKPNSLADVYGSAWLTSGAGSVALLEGVAGDTVLGFKQLKPILEPVGPFKVIHDHAAGTTSIHQNADPLAMAREAGESGITVKDVAADMTDKDDPSRNDIEAARRKLKRLEKEGLLHEFQRPAPGGGKATQFYVLTQSHEQSRAEFGEIES